MAMYGRVAYWDERYRATSSGPYDWYQTYGNLRHLLNVGALTAATKLDSATPFPSPDKCRVLILGCGNSPFAEEMIHEGWSGPITNVDFSPVVIDQMKSKYSNNQEFRSHYTENANMGFVCADITEGLPFADKSFDLIICKGTFDAILCSSGSVANAKILVAECSRVLANGHGVFFLVSYGNPDSRVLFLEHQNDLSFYWQEVSIHTVGRQTSSGQKKDYIYTCRKRIEDVARHHRPLLASKSTEENVVHKESTLTEEPKGVAPVAG